MIQAEATARYVRTSAQKAGLVLDLIRGKDVNRALATLKFTRKGIAGDIEKVLRSAIANAETRREDEIVVGHWSLVIGHSSRPTTNDQRPTTKDEERREIQWARRFTRLDSGSDSTRRGGRAGTRTATTRSCCTRIWRC